MKIIPAIDIINGKCVRLSLGNFESQTNYQDDPLIMAREFELHSLNRLHLVDLDGARSSMVTNWDVLERIAANTSLVIDFSGGIKSREDIQKAFQSGASMVAIGSMAAKQPELIKEWISEFGAEKFIIGADVKDEHIMINGWNTATDLTWQEVFKKYIDLGVVNIFCTDINKDGLLEGPSFDLYRAILKAFPAVNLIASGGVSSMNDLEKLAEIGCEAAIVGKAIYEKKISLEELKLFNEQC